MKRMVAVCGLCVIALPGLAAEDFAFAPYVEPKPVAMSIDSNTLVRLDRSQTVTIACAEDSERAVEWAEARFSEWKTARARIVVQHIPPPLCKGGWAPKLKRLDALNEVWKTANVTLMMGAHLHWWCWMDPWEGRPYPLVVGGGPYLGSPAKHNNATLTKCRLEGNCLSVKVLDQTGKAVITKEIALS